MSPAARSWLDAFAMAAAILTFTATGDRAQAAPHSQETSMQAPPSEGPFRAVPASPTGYSTIHDREGRMIGAALTGNDLHSRGLPKESVEQNGRLFAASHSLCVALTSYMNAVDKGLAEGFDGEVIEQLDEARQEASDAFAILMGRAS